MVTSLLWQPLPWWWPVAPEPPRGLRGLIVRVRDRVRSELDLDFDRRMRRAATQRLVREVYQHTLAEQQDQRRRPDAFADAWRARLAEALANGSRDVDGWGQITAADVDQDLAWSLLAAVTEGRAQTLRQAVAEPSRTRQMGRTATADFEFRVVAGSVALGRVAYSVCQPCEIGLLRKISFSPEWQFCGLGTLAMRQLEVRHAGLTWYTTPQYADARGFYARYREGSASSWTDQGGLCQHFS